MDIWKDAPDWLKQKRQLAGMLQSRFPQAEKQEKWMHWQTMPIEQVDWIQVKSPFIAMPLTSAIHEFTDILQENLMEKGINWQANQLYAAHLANLDGGQFIFVPENTMVDLPIEFAGAGMMSNPHNVILVGANSKVTIKEKLQIKSAQPMFAGTELLLGAGAQVEFHQDNTLRAPAVYSAVHAYQARDAHLSCQLRVADEGDHTVSLYSFLDGAHSTWDSEVHLNPGRTGELELKPSVDGYGAGSKATLTTYLTENAGGKASVRDFKPASGEPLDIESHVLSENSPISGQI